MNTNAINFLRDSLNHHYGLRSAMDQKASFLVGIAAIIFGFSMTRLEELNFLILAICSFIALFLSAMAVFLPFRGKRTERISLMCWWNFAKKGYDKYQCELNDIFQSDEKIVEEYSRDIWNLANYSIKPKTLILGWANAILITGLLAGFVLFFV
jgi:hypothetical protein